MGSTVFGELRPRKRVASNLASTAPLLEKLLLSCPLVKLWETQRVESLHTLILACRTESINLCDLYQR